MAPWLVLTSLPGAAASLKAHLLFSVRSTHDSCVRRRPPNTFGRCAFGRVRAVWLRYACVCVLCPVSPVCIFVSTIHPHSKSAYPSSHIVGSISEMLLPNRLKRWVGIIALENRRNRPSVVGVHRFRRDDFMPTCENWPTGRLRFKERTKYVVSRCIHYVIYTLR